MRALRLAGGDGTRGGCSGGTTATMDLTVAAAKDMTAAGPDMVPSSRYGHPGDTGNSAEGVGKYCTGFDDCKGQMANLCSLLRQRSDHPRTTRSSARTPAATRRRPATAARTPPVSVRASAAPGARTAASAPPTVGPTANSVSRRRRRRGLRHESGTQRRLNVPRARRRRCCRSRRGRRRRRRRGCSRAGWRRRGRRRCAPRRCWRSRRAGSSTRRPEALPLWRDRRRAGAEVGGGDALVVGEKPRSMVAAPMSALDTPPSAPLPPSSLMFLPPQPGEGDPACQRQASRLRSLRIPSR